MSVRVAGLGKLVHAVKKRLSLDEFSSTYEKHLSDKTCLVLEFVASDCTETFEHFFYVIASTTSAKSRILRVIYAAGIEIQSEFNIAKNVRLTLGYGYRLHTTVHDVFKKFYGEAHLSYVLTESNKKTLIVSVRDLYFALSRVFTCDNIVNFLSELGVLTSAREVERLL